jgi:hypothetical protein
MRHNPREPRHVDLDGSSKKSLENSIQDAISKKYYIQNWSLSGVARRTRPASERSELPALKDWEELKTKASIHEECRVHHIPDALPIVVEVEEGGELAQAGRSASRQRVPVLGQPRLHRAPHRLDGPSVRAIGGAELAAMAYGRVIIAKGGETALPGPKVNRGSMTSNQYQTHMTPNHDRDCVSSNRYQTHHCKPI